MVSINKSFFYGIAVASVTWMLYLYFYINLTVNKHLNVGLPSEKTIIQNTSFILTDDLDDLGLLKSLEDKKIKDDGYKVHAYNVLVSNRLALNRSIPDTRNALCKNRTYSSNLPKTSVIICFYNEHFRTLLRTIHSIINRTPSTILEEIILVDDESDIKDLHTNLKEYIASKKLFNVKLFRTERREGLIRARMFGARKAQGQVLLFLDSHIEVNVGWIEPLLDRIKEKRSHVVMPIIDIISPDTFKYSASPLVRGGFNWGLHFKWDNLPKGSLKTKEDFIKPIKSPTMAGGLFAIDKKYFIDIGEYDAGMNIWGGENLEISFRIWMCGGSLELMPCSRVGHIFRHRRPYGSPDGEDTMLHNSLRVAHVWMDSYKDFFLKERFDAKKIDYGDISSRLHLRKELKCFDFDWFLKHVYPELPLPTEDGERLKKKWSALEKDKYQPWHLRKRNYIDQYSIKLTDSNLCISSEMNVLTKGSGLVLKVCAKNKNQMWYETDKSELVLGQLLCLEYGKANPILYKCHEMGGDQEWKHKEGKETAIYNLAAGLCLAAENRTINTSITMKICTDPELATWDLIR